MRKKRKVVKELFSTPNGKKVMEYLEQEFDHDDIRSADPHNTYYRLGQRDVVMYLKQLLRGNEND